MLVMSQESRKTQSGERDISRVANENGTHKNYEGFEGMNYEQFRKPYNSNSMNRNSSTEERNESKRPDEG